MRVSESMKSLSLLGDMNRTMERMVKTQRDISSTKQIHKPSDDPGGTARAMRLKEVMARYERYTVNVDDGLQWLNVTDSALNTTEETVRQADSLLLQASNDTVSADVRRTLSTQMQSLWERLVQTANQQFGDRYIFSGTSISAPYTLTNQIQNEAWTAAAGEAVRLNNVRLETGSTVVSEPLSGTTDYSMDLTAGTVTALGTGTMEDGATYYATFNAGGATFTDQPFVADLDNPVSLGHADIQPGSVVIHRRFTEGSDYTVDNDSGTLTALATGNLRNGSAYEVSYRTRGNAVADLGEVGGTVTRTIDNGISETINLNSGDLFDGDQGLLNIFHQAVTALQRNDLNGIREARGNLTTGRETLTRLIGETGVRINSFEFQKNKLTQDRTNAEQLLSSIQDTDITKAMVQLQRDQTAYQAALNSTAQIMQKSLMDYLG